jgi:phospho-N-acetylmuramoyl-pentapeptide-transferase
VLYHLLYPLRTHVPVFNVFRYITFRGPGRSSPALLFVFMFGPWIIDPAPRQGGQPIRDRRTAIAPRRRARRPWAG